MINIRNSIWNKRLPRGLGLLVLLFSLGSIFWLSRNAVLLGTRAAIGNAPKNVQISNIAKDSFTISYVTDQAVTGSVSYGTNQEGSNVALDTRDPQSPQPHNIHYIILKNLTPSTKYFYSILSGDKIFKNGESLYEITTAPDSNATSSAQTRITGTVKLEDGSNPPEAIAYINSNGSQLLSTLVQPDGNYSISINSIRSSNLTGFLSLLPETPLKLRIVNQTLQSSVNLLTSQANPVPPVVLSRNYDFTISSEPLAGTSASESAQITGFPTPDEAQVSSGPQILTPKADQEFKDQQPLFQGKALPGNDVEITIQSSHEITTTVQADENGNWQFRPDTELTPGEHTITIKTLNAQGILQTLTRSFTVFAEGSQFVEPSVSPTVTLAPTPTGVPTPTNVPSAAITATPAPTQSVPTPTVIPSPTIAGETPAPTAQITIPPIPNSGSSALTFGFAGLSILIGIGSLLFFLL